VSERSGAVRDDDARPVPARPRPRHRLDAIRESSRVDRPATRFHRQRGAAEFHDGHVHAVGRETRETRARARVTRRTRNRPDRSETSLSNASRAVRMRATPTAHASTTTTRAARVSSAARSRARVRASFEPSSSSSSVARAVATAVVALVLARATPSLAEFYIEDVPEGLRASESAERRARPSLRRLTSGPNGGAIEKCANKCLATCARGGGGGPGLGPASVRRDPFVFKESFRSREYCLYECASACSESINGR
jgi:hypothetical protein